MSKTALVGAIGVGHQSAKDNVASSVLYVPATSVNLNPVQNVQTLPAEVGGSYFLRGAYKTAVTGSGDVSFVVRPQSIGHFFLMLCGQDTVTNPSTGVYTHTFTPFAAGSGTDLPWYTLMKDVSGLHADQFLNGRMNSLTIDVPKASIATAQTSLLATTPSAVTSSSLGTKTFDTSPQFQTCIATVSLTQEGSGSNISANSIKSERFNFAYASHLSNDEFSVGNYYLDDITLLQRTVQVNTDFILRDDALYQAVYLNGNTEPSAWQPTLYRGSLTVTLTSNANIPTTSTPYSLQFSFPGLDFMLLPIPMQGAELIRASLSTQVTLGTNQDQFSVVLTNGIASY